MGLLSKISKFLSTSSNPDKKSRYIYYKIVDFVNKSEKFTLQCINTNAIFYATIMDIVSDVDILHGLHPIQACYVGMEYSKYFRQANSYSKPQANQKVKSKQYSEFRYGSYRLCYQDRTGNICFTNPYSEKMFIMDPRDVALSEELIKEFDASQAFHIGLFAGLKLNSIPRPSNRPETNNQNCLRLIK